MEDDEIRSLSKRDDNLGRKLPYIKITRGKKAFRIPRIIQHSCVMGMKISRGRLKRILNKMARSILVTT